MKLKPAVFILDRIKKRLKIRDGAAGEILLDGDDLAGIYNPHYARASDICHIIGFVSYALLVVFILGAVLLNLGDITYENLYYFIKDFGAVAAAEDFSASPVIYSYAEDRSYTGTRADSNLGRRHCYRVFGDRPQTAGVYRLFKPRDLRLVEIHTCF